MSYHRNGISGRGFWTIIFRGHEDADSLVKGYVFDGRLTGKTGRSTTVRAGNC